jgi:hypothetical protein
MTRCAFNTDRRHVHVLGCAIHNQIARYSDLIALQHVLQFSTLLPKSVQSPSEPTDAVSKQCSLCQYISNTSRHKALRFVVNSRGSECYEKPTVLRLIELAQVSVVHEEVDFHDLTRVELVVIWEEAMLTDMPQSNDGSQ